MSSNALEPVIAQSAKSGISPQTKGLVRQAIAATGLILVRSAGDAGELRPRGSAVIVRRDGIAATNLHVVTDSRTGKLYDEIMLSLSSGSDARVLANRYRSTVVMIDRDSDLVLIRIQRDGASPKALTFPTVEIGDSKSVEMLDDIFIIGFPEKGGATVTVNHGVVEGKDDLLKWIKTDARLIHGNSGGAAVNSEGKLIGIPTKVVPDQQPIDRDGDGFPDEYRRYGAVGFLRPSQLVASMLSRFGNETSSKGPSGPPAAPAEIEREPAIVVQGIVRSSTSHKPLAGAIVGLLRIGTALSASTLLCWGGTDPDGRFKLNRPVPRGRYVVRAKAPGYKMYTAEVDIGPTTATLAIEM